MGPQGRALDEGRAAAAALERLLSEAHAPPEYAPAATALRHGRLKLTWLDSGEMSLLEALRQLGAVQQRCWRTEPPSEHHLAKSWN